MATRMIITQTMKMTMTTMTLKNTVTIKKEQQQ